MGDYLFNIFPNKNFIDLNMFQYGWEKCKSSQSFGPSRRNHYLFHFVISGKGTLYIDDSKGNNHEFHVNMKQGFMICPEVVSTYVADVEEPWEYLWIEFDGLLVKEMLNQAGLSKDTPIYVSDSKSRALALENEMLYMAQHGDESPLHIIGHLYMALDHLLESSVNKRELVENNLVEFYVTEAIAFIELNYHKEISVGDIAKSCGLNRSYFGKIFREHIGTTPQNFLMNYRMRKAAELLEMTKLKIKEICPAIGYPDQLNFSRAFRNIYGISPSDWRKAHTRDGD